MPPTSNLLCTQLQTSERDFYYQPLTTWVLASAPSGCNKSGPTRALQDALLAYNSFCKSCLAQAETQDAQVLTELLSSVGL